MSTSPLYERGYRDAVEGMPHDPTLIFYWGYRMGFKVGLATRENRDELAARRCA